MIVSRADTGLIARWWFTVDRTLLTTILTLAASGLLILLAASPAVALRNGLSELAYVRHQLLFVTLSMIGMLGVSLLEPKTARRLALMLLALSLLSLISVLAVGHEINGARRWLSIAGVSIQPTEIAKPAFVVVVSALLAEAERRPDMPAMTLAIVLFALTLGLIIPEPDVGQSFLITLAFGVLLIVSGRSSTWIIGLALAGVVGLALAYLRLDYVHARVDRFFLGDAETFSQGRRALRSFTEGGLTGRGPGEGTIKLELPDAHTDFILAVLAEEYGVIACLALLALYATVVVRGLTRAGSDTDPFFRNAIVGLSAIFGAQALVNMGVNVGLLPAKGMTLPLVSSGGSSALGIGLELGFLLCFTRKRPGQRVPFRPAVLAALEHQVGVGG